MSDEQQQFNTNWNILVIPHEDGTIDSRHVGLTLVGAVAILKAVLDDYEAELAKEVPADPVDAGN